MTTDDLSLSGSLEEAPVPELVRGVIRSKDSGVLELRVEGATSRLCFRGGKLVFASSDDPDLRLPEILLRTGQITLAQYDEAARRSAGKKNPGAVLCELGVISPDDLIRCVEVQVREIVLRAFGAGRGEYVLTFGETLPPGAVVMQLPGDRIILDGVQRIDRWSRISAALGDRGMTLRRTAGQDQRLFALDLAEDENGIFSLLSTPFTLAELCRMSYLSNFETCRIAWGLLCLNLVEEVRGAATAGVAAEPAAADATLATAVTNYNGAYTAMYRIVYGRIGEEIQDFVVELVDGLPAEMRRALAGIDLSEGGRVDLARFEANLRSERPGDLSAAGQEILSELLYRWVFAVKGQFGAEVEREVASALNAMNQS